MAMKTTSNLKGNTWNSTNDRRLHNAKAKSASLKMKGMKNRAQRSIRLKKF